MPMTEQRTKLGPTSEKAQRQALLESQHKCMQISYMRHRLSGGVGRETTG